MTYPPPPSQDPLQPAEPGRPGDDPQAPPTTPLSPPPLSPWAPPPADATPTSGLPRPPGPAGPYPPTPQPPPAAPPGPPGPPGPAHPGQPYLGQPYPGQPYPGQPHPGPPYPGPPHQGPPGGYPPGPGYPPPARPPRRNNGPLVALVVVIALLLCGGTVTAGVMIVNAARNKAQDVVAGLPTAGPELPALPTELPTDLPTFAPDVEDATPATVVYEVTGDGPVDLHYTDGSGSSKREKGVKLPWRKEFTDSDAALLSVMASRATFDKKGSLTCRATVDGVEVAKRTVEGKFLLVSCVKYQG
jgi:hypothetical protein